MKKHLPGIVVAVLIIVAVAYAEMIRSSSGGNELSQEIAGEDSATVADSMYIEPPKLLYGINIDSLEVIEGSIRRNQNLSEILSKFNVSYATIDRLARNFREVFDVRKIAANKKYTIFCAQDSLKTAMHFVYEPNAMEYVVFRLQDSLDVYKAYRKVDTVIQRKAGVIEYSLYNTMLDAGSSPLLANNLSDVFAWQIDFFTIQKGDRFKVIYEELQIDGQPIAVGNILAASFDHANSSYFGFYFDQNGDASYFDETGASLRKAFLKAPLKYSRISSRFTNSRFHPVLKIRRPHHGVDYAAPTGTPVHSVGDGVVQKVAYERGGGNYVKIKHNSVYETGYMHLSRFAKGIAPGKRVTQGQVIGYVGSTGLSTGPHLDFRYWKNGSPVNPLTIKSPPSEPVKQDYKAAFEQIKNEMTLQLETIQYPDAEQSPVVKVN